MKAFFRNMVQAYRGKCDGLVYYYNPRLNRIIARQYVKPKPTENTRRFALIVANLKALNPSQGFRSDLDMYVTAFNAKPANRNKPMQNWYNAYTKLMYALAKKYDGTQGGENPFVVDLATITREQIYEQNLPCKSVYLAIDSGLLPMVNGCHLMTAEI